MAAGMADAAMIPASGSDQAAIINGVIHWVEAAISADRKVNALKTLQGHIWRGGFSRGEMKAELFRDVPDSIVELRSLGVKTYVYSSGSREAQKQFFGHTLVGVFCWEGQLHCWV